MGKTSSNHSKPVTAGKNMPKKPNIISVKSNEGSANVSEMNVLGNSNSN